MKKLLVIGDTHGDASWIKRMMHFAKLHECDAIIQLGDFGLWPGGEGYLNAIAKTYWKTQVPVYWIDGNHDWHDRIDGIVREQMPHNDGEYAVRNGLFYIPRGNVWTWEGVKFGALGGAFSIDRDNRQLGLSYWEQELPTYEQVDTLKANSGGKLDILLTHDAPELPTELNLAGYKVDATSAYSRKVIQHAVAETKPKYLFHGHYHTYAHSVYEGTQVRGLNANPMARNNRTPSQGILIIEDGAIEFGSISNERTRIN